MAADFRITVLRYLSSGDQKTSGAGAGSAARSLGFWNIYWRWRVVTGRSRPLPHRPVMSSQHRIQTWIPNPKQLLPSTTKSRSAGFDSNSGAHRKSRVDFWNVRKSQGIQFSDILNAFISRLSRAAEHGRSHSCPVIGWRVWPCALISGNKIYNADAREFETTGCEKVFDNIC